MRGALIALVAVACGPVAKPAPAALANPAPAPLAKPAPPAADTSWGPSKTDRSAPAPFLDEPGLTQVSITTTTPTEWGSSSNARMQVLRGGRVVCELDAGSWGTAENHSWRDGIAVVRVARDPLRFEERTSFRDNSGLTGDDPNSTCTRYELPATGACKKVLARQCAITCVPTATVSSRPGTGQVVGTATGDGMPLANVMVAAVGDHGGGSQTDADGTFAFASDATMRAIYVDIGTRTTQLAIAPQADRDTVVTITATGCSCCASPPP